LIEVAQHRISTLETNSQARSHRLVYFDLARCMAFFLTVFAHLYSVNSGVRLYIYAFHMPLFFLLSGYLHKNTSPGILIGKSAKWLLGG
jgi:fucose 4-O-acetylase-like acetyltransferase